MKKIQLVSMIPNFESIMEFVNNKGYSFLGNSANKSKGVYQDNISMNACATYIIESFFNTMSNFSEAVMKEKNGMKNCLISNPIFHHTNSKVDIQLFYYMPNFFSKREKISTSPWAATQNKNMNSMKSNSNEIQQISFYLTTSLTSLFKKEVNLHLIHLNYPYLNSTILSKYLAHNAPSNTFLQFHEAILTYPSIHCTSLPAHISGIKVQISGRLVTEPVVPRMTVKSAVIGSFNMNDSSTFIDYSKYTTKNELGAFTIKVWICQRKGKETIS